MTNKEAIEILRRAIVEVEWEYPMEIAAAMDRAIEALAKGQNVGKSFGRWKRIVAGMTPGGTPMYSCENCGGSDHLHGAEYPKRKIICDCCGQINIYPFEKAYEEGASLFPRPEPQKKMIMPELPKEES